MALTILQVALGLSLMASLLLLPLFYFLVITKRTSSHKTKLPPSPPKLPLIGNLHQLGSLPHHSLASLSKKYGPLMLLRLGEIPTLVISSADMAREIMRTHDLIFASRPKWKVAEILLYNNKNLAFSPYGEYWRNVRKLCTIHLLSAKRVQSYHLMREEEVAFMIEKIIRRYCSSPTTIDMSEVLYSFANDMICRVVSGKLFRGGRRNELFRELLEENSCLAGAFNIEDYFPWLAWLGVFFGLSSRAEKNFKRWDDLLDEVIEEHENGNDDGEEDFVDVLLSLQKGSNLDFELEKDHMKAILVDMFGAGTETTFITLEWAMAEIVRNCEVMKKLQDEVRGIVGENRMVREAELNAMTYLKAVVKETLRLHPPATLLVPRESLDGCYIKDYFVPKKTQVFVNGWAINRDPAFWEEPHEFRPERFIDSSVDFKGHDFQFIPFGAGRRICPGMQFAVLDIELALANLVHRFEWELPHGLRREELDMSEKPGFLTPRAEKLHLVAKPCLL